MQDKLSLELFYMVIFILISILVSQTLHSFLGVSQFSLLIFPSVTFLIFFLYYYSVDGHTLVKFKPLSKGDIAYFTILLLIFSVLLFLSQESIVSSGIIGSIDSVFGLLIIFAVAVIEEILFRGLIFENLKRVTEAKYAIFLSSFFFATYHITLIGNISILFSLFVIGIILCMSYKDTENISVPILLHIFYNTMIVFPQVF